MKFLKLNILFLIVALTGCKAFVESEVKLSELLTSKTKDIAGDLYIEVSSCSSYEDSRQESKSLIEAKNAVPQIFSGAKFVECFEKKFDAYAHFSLPIKLDKDKDDKLASDSLLNIVSNDGSLLTVGIPPVINQRLEQLQKNSYGTKSFDLIVNIKVINDTGKDHPFKVISAYIENEPYVYGDLTVKAGGSFTVRLSDVSVDQAKSSGAAMVLLH
jgi:hypothetical protein